MKEMMKASSSQLRQMMTIQSVVHAAKFNLSAERRRPTYGLGS